jgi:S-adenosylmethionine-dependent methyltransferase
VLRPHGLLSVVSLNRYAEAYRRALLRLDPAGARAAPATDTFATPRFGGIAMRPATADGSIRVLAAAGCSVVGRCGVRCVCDHMPDNDVKRDPAFFAHPERLELAMSDRYPYYLLAKFFQVIARTELRR